MLTEINTSLHERLHNGHTSNSVSSVYIIGQIAPAASQKVYYSDSTKEH